MFARLALQQRHFTRRGFGLRPHDAATVLFGVGHAPFAQPGGQVGGGGRMAAVGAVGQVLGHVEADAAGADDAHALAHGLVVQQHVDVAQHGGVILPWNARVARCHAGGQHHLCKATRGQLLGAGALAQVLHHAQGLQTAGEVAQGFIELFLARDRPGHVELATDARRAFEQVHLEATFGQRAGSSQAGRAGAHHCGALARGRRPDHELGLVAGARVHQAAGDAVLEGVVQAGLVAGDAGVDLVAAAALRLGHEVGIGQEGPCQAHQIGAAIGQHGFGHFGHVQAVAGDDRYAVAFGVQRAAQLLRHPGKGGTGHAGGDGGYARFVPADAGVEDAGAGFGDGTRQLHHLGPGAAVRDQVDQADAVDEDEVGPHGFADAAHHLHRQPHAVAVVAAPAVAAVVGVGDQELVDEVALAAHHFHAVIARFLRQPRAAHEGTDLALDATLGQLPRREPRDRALDARRRHAQRAVAVAPGVQDLQGDAATLGMHGRGDLAVPLRRPGSRQGAGKGLGPAFDVGREAPGDDQAHAAARALGIKRRHAGEVLAAVFQTGVHAAHQYAVLQRDVAQVQRGQQMGVGAGGWQG